MCFALAIWSILLVERGEVLHRGDVVADITLRLSAFEHETAADDARFFVIVGGFLYVVRLVVGECEVVVIVGGGVGGGRMCVEAVADGEPGL